LLLRGGPQACPIDVTMGQSHPQEVPVSRTIVDIPTQLRRIRTWNLVAGCAHLVQLVLILILANDFSLPVTATYMEGPPGTPPSIP